MLRIVGELVDGQCARSVGKVVVGRRQVVSGRRDGRHAHGGCGGDRAQRWHASDVGAAGVFIVDVAGNGAGQRRVVRTVEPRLVVGGNCELCFADRQAAIVGRDQVVAIGQSRGINGVAANTAATGCRCAQCAAQAVAVDQTPTGAGAIGRYRVGQRRIGVAIGLCLAIGRHRQGSLADRQRAVGLREVIVGCRQGTGVAGNGGCSNTSARGGGGGAAATASHTRRCQHLAIDEAADRTAERRIGRAVGARLVIRSHRQVRLQDNAIGVAEGGAASQHVIGSVSPRKADAADLVTQASADIDLAECATATDRHHVAGFLAREPHGDTGHGSGSIVRFTHTTGVGSHCFGADLLGTDNDQLVAEVATGATGDGATKLVAADLQEAGRAIGCTCRSQGKGHTVHRHVVAAGRRTGGSDGRAGHVLRTRH